MIANLILILSIHLYASSIKVHSTRLTFVTLIYFPGVFFFSLLQTPKCNCKLFERFKEFIHCQIDRYYCFKCSQGKTSKVKLKPYFIFYAVKRLHSYSYYQEKWQIHGMTELYAGWWIVVHLVEPLIP